MLSWISSGPTYYELMSLYFYLSLDDKYCSINEHCRHTQLNLWYKFYSYKTKKLSILCFYDLMNIILVNGDIIICEKKVKTLSCYGINLPRTFIMPRATMVPRFVRKFIHFALSISGISTAIDPKLCMKNTSQIISSSYLFV